MKACNFFVCALVVSSFLLTADSAKADQQTAAKILLIGKKPDHPHGTHMYMHTNAILWTAHVEVPPQVAPVELSEAELRLPPESQGE